MSGVVRAAKAFAIVSCLGLTTLAAEPAAAGDLVYQPVDPSFGGNPFNSAHLLGIANAQNDYKDPSSTQTNSQAERCPSSWEACLMTPLNFETARSSKATLSPSMREP